MTIVTMPLGLRPALFAGYLLAVHAHAADLVDNDGPKIDLTPPPMATAPTGHNTPEQPPTISAQAPPPPQPAESHPAMSQPATTTPTPSSELDPDATAPQTPTPVAPTPTQPAAPQKKSPPHEPPSKVSIATASASGQADTAVARARESAIIKAAEKRLLEREAQLVDPIREILLREASLIAQATQEPGKNTAPASRAPAPKYDRVTTAERLVLCHDFRMAKVLLRSIETSSGVTQEERAKAALLLAKVDLYEGKSSDAVVKLGAWLTEFPRRRESPFVYYLLGQAYRDLGVYELSRDNFYRVISGTLMSVSNSDDSSYNSEKRLVRAAIWQLAETEYVHQNWERALTYFERFYTQSPSGDQLVEASLFRKADCQYQLRRLPEAVSGYQRALAVAPFHPFGPEAWLRLYFLYGSNNQPDKQQEAMQALTWLVKNFEPGRLTYWQQRAVAMMMEMPLENRAQIVSLREGLRAHADDPNWKSLYSQLDDLCSRLTLERPDNAPTPTAATAPQSADAWAKWKSDYTHKRKQLQQQAKQLLERQPVNTTTRPHTTAPTQG